MRARPTSFRVLASECAYIIPVWYYSQCAVGGQWSPSRRPRRRLGALVVLITSDIASGEYNIDYWVTAAQLSVCGTLADMSSSEGRPELVSGQRWEARARVDFPLHYLIWLREHKLLEEKLDATGSGQQPAVKVNCVSTLLKRNGVLRITPPKKKFWIDRFDQKA